MQNIDNRDSIVLRPGAFRTYDLAFTYLLQTHSYAFSLEAGNVVNDKLRRSAVTRLLPSLILLSIVPAELFPGVHSGGALRTYDLSDVYVGVCVADNR